jgi:transcriptional regulator with XRE-family HTH domain
MTMAELAEATKRVDPNGKGLQVPYISDLENSRRGRPGSDNLEMLANALRVSPSYFLNTNTQLPTEAISHIPPNILDWLMGLESMPYVVLAKQMFEMKLPPEAAKGILESLQTAMQNDVKK